MPENGLLAIFAHPDDETFGVGATMAIYADRGVPVTMVCATRGEVGEIAPDTGATPETLGQFREQELRDAMRILGVEDVRFLGYRDSGMAGTEDNEDPRSLAKAHPDGVTHMLTKIIRETKPRVIVTWDPTGGYGHPDHLAVHHTATAAYHAAPDASKYPSAGAPWKPDALYYTTIPIEKFIDLWEELRKRGIDPGEPPGDMDAALSLQRLEPNCVIDVNTVFDRKRLALMSHRTQISPSDPFMNLPEDLDREFFSKEYFRRVDPPVPGGTMLTSLEPL
jgi:LmbE family N-acetylglucosaminyl deacetylase